MLFAVWAAVSRKDALEIDGDGLVGLYSSAQALKYPSRHALERDSLSVLIKTFAQMCPCTCFRDGSNSEEPLYPR